jgi:hypothetical protein
MSLLETKAPNTLEIGLGCGGSALVFTQTHKDLGDAARSSTLQLMHFKMNFDGAGLLAIERAGLNQYLNFREERSSLALPALLREQRKFGLIYVDGSHSFDEVFVDLYFSVRLLEVGGIVLLDDSSDHDVRNVIHIARKQLRRHVAEVDLLSYRTDKLKPKRHRKDHDFY